MRSTTKDKNKNRTSLYITILQITYVLLFFIFLLSAFTVDILVAPPAAALLRVPSNLRAIGFFLNAPWTQSLRIYHLFLLIITVLGALNLIALSNLGNSFWRTVCKISSFFSLFIIWSIFLFFTLPFILSGIAFDPTYLKTAFIYASVSFIVLIVDIATFAVADGLD